MTNPSLLHDNVFCHLLPAVLRNSSVSMKPLQIPTILAQQRSSFASKISQFIFAHRLQISPLVLDRKTWSYRSAHVNICWNYSLANMLAIHHFSFETSVFLTSWTQTFRSTLTWFKYVLVTDTPQKSRKPTSAYPFVMAMLLGLIPASLVGLLCIVTCKVKKNQEITNLPTHLLWHLVTLLDRLLPASLRRLFPALRLRDLSKQNLKITNACMYIINKV